MLDKIQDRFAESIQIQIATADVLPEVLNNAASKIVDCLLSGHKIIVCGHGRSYTNAQLFVSHLLHRYDLERPSLYAHLLHFDAVFASQLNQERNLEQIYKKQLQVVASKQDIFIAFSPMGNETCVLDAISYANSEDLTILAFTSNQNDHTQGLLGDDDIEISIPSSNEMRVIEGHLFCINLICELVDHLLFNPISNN
ncbi:SIS domain-containing protein [Otariodibacter sp.]|uniref:D-sedoheptulose-7-phosphate isomerase n=1 Tax=Otariodibacter sp. TaxID=3030919 RepID=UPI002602F9C7|nr:SIS domain-containing protein [Otariodibacter sp.]